MCYGWHPPAPKDGRTSVGFVEIPAKLMTRYTLQAYSRTYERFEAPQLATGDATVFSKLFSQSCFLQAA
jgi:hypothetical protein